MATIINKNSRTLAEVETELKALFGTVGEANQSAAIAASTMCAIATKAAQATLDGLFAKGKAGEVGKHVYALSGKNPATDSSFGSQASKIAKFIKMAERWDGKGMGTVELVCSITSSQYNDALSLLGIVQRQTDKANVPPPVDDVKGWWANKPKAATTTNNASRAAKVLDLLKEIGETDPRAEIVKATAAMAAYVEVAGATAEMQKAVEKDKATRKAYADQVAKVLAASKAKPGKDNGAKA